MLDASPPVSVPRIATSRLLLRELRPADFDDYAQNLLDPDATAHLSPVKNRRDAWKVFTSMAGTWMLHGAGWWGVELGGTDKLVGNVGVFYREDATDLEIGWLIYRAHWGRGFASEAAAAALAHGLETLGKPRVIAHIDAGNAASIRVSEKLGMRYDGDVAFGDERVGLYVASAPASYSQR